MELAVTASPIPRKVDSPGAKAAAPAQVHSENDSGHRDCRVTVCSDMRFPVTPRYNTYITNARSALAGQHRPAVRQCWCRTSLGRGAVHTDRQLLNLSQPCIGTTRRRALPGGGYRQHPTQRHPPHARLPAT
jgi:hypothetical protein